MKAFISVLPDGNSRIEFINEFGVLLDIYMVSEIHVETAQDNIEPVHRKANKQRKYLRTGYFVQ